MRWILLLVGVLGLGLGCGKVDDAPNCAPNELACGDRCIDPLNDLDHCGQCGVACEAGLVCGNGQCATGCPAGQEQCGGTCVDTQTDFDHCGVCGMTCGVDQECRAGSCQVRCDVGLTAPVTDPWGFQWDGLERAAAPLDLASTTCAGFGARLPSATELYRASANQSGSVGQSFHTNYLWSAAPADRLAQATVRLSDAISSTAAATSMQPYRCVCAPPQPAFFAGTRCNGPAGSECVSMGRTNLDRSDRPALRRSSAVWECTHERAHLADFPALVEGIEAGAPGSNAYVATADMSQYYSSTSLRWTTAAGWQVNGNISFVDLRTAAPFRCAGPSFVAGTHPVAVASEFTAGTYKAEAVDNPTSAWAAAHDTCFARGGHLPRASELAELIMQGLPGGSDQYLWTSDQTGYNGTHFLAATMKWANLDRRFPFEHLGNGNETNTWHYKTDTRPSRCIYYPIDPIYALPATCNGGCFDSSPPVGPSKLVLDAMDRAPATQAAAFAACRAEGGRLASERDLTEAIRKGLANGSGTQLLTSDLGGGNILVVYWTGVDTAYTDQWSTYMTWLSPDNSRPYRCAWTNEVR